MKLHFIGALEGDKDSYRLIVGLSKSFGWDVVTEHSMVRKVDDVKNETPDEANEYARKMQRWIKAADVIVVEATTGVLGAGYEVATALNYGKPVVVLYQDHGSNAPHVLLGLTSDRLQVIDYNINNLKSILRASL